MKAALEKKIFEEITEFENTYDYIVKSIRCRKDDFGESLNGITIIIEDNDDPKYTKSFKESFETDILDSIQTFEFDHNVTFKSLKTKKDKDGQLSGIVLEFDGDDIPLDNKFQKGQW